MHTQCSSPIAHTVHAHAVQLTYRPHSTCTRSAVHLSPTQYMHTVQLTYPPHSTCTQCSSPIPHTVHAHTVQLTYRPHSTCIRSAAHLLPTRPQEVRIEYPPLAALVPYTSEWPRTLCTLHQDQLCVGVCACGRVVCVCGGVL